MTGFRAIFTAYDSSNTQTVWVTDGTDAGTVPLVSSLFGTPVAYFLTTSVSLGNSVLFGGVDTNSKQQVFLSDGTVAGTSVVGTPGVASYGLNPLNLTHLDGSTYFLGNSAAAPGSAWSMADGSASATVLAGQLLQPTSFASVGGTIYSTGYLPHTNTYGIYRYDAGPVATPLSLSGFARPDGMIGLGSNLLFRGDEPSNFTSLFSYDTVGGGVTELTSSTGVKPFLPIHMTALNGFVYFEAATSNAGGATTSLWRTDGTSAGTEVLSLPGLKALSTTVANNQPFPTMGGKLLLGAVDTGNKNQLFVTDGTPAGTTEVTASGAAATGLTPQSIAGAGDTAVMAGQNALGKTDLWRLDGGTMTLTKLAPAQAGSWLGIFGFFPAGAVAFNVACFLAGTRILAADGPVAVERLRVGQMVATHGGGVRPIKWIGRRRIDCRRHPEPASVHPVRIMAGAFGEGVPGRDVLLSPDHAVFADGVLVPVRYLVNGATIRREGRSAVTYYHVELDRHDVVLAEGLPCESYLDTGNRGDFEGGTVVRLHPAFARHAWEVGAAAPLVVEGPVLEGVRRRLLGRAGALGFGVSREPELRVLAAGVSVAGERVGGRVRFAVPGGRVRLVSRSGVPAETRADGRDTRRLGVAVAGMWLDGAAIGLGDGRLGAGWHAMEAGGAWRWTDGAAALAIEGGVLEIAVAMGEVYWLAPVEAGRRRGVG